MDISFPELPLPKVTCMGTVVFQVVVDSQFLWCEISCEALRDCFGALSMDKADLLDSFDENKDKIQHAAQDYLELNNGHPVLLMCENFK